MISFLSSIFWFVVMSMCVYRVGQLAYEIMSQVVGWIITKLLGRGDE